MCVEICMMFIDPYIASRYHPHIYRPESEIIASCHYHDHCCGLSGPLFCSHIILVALFRVFSDLSTCVYSFSILRRLPTYNPNNKR